MADGADRRATARLDVASRGGGQASLAMPAKQSGDPEVHVSVFTFYFLLFYFLRPQSNTFGRQGIM
jgi:hypothetical protein